MARPSATAALLLLVFSLLAVVHCHTLAADHDTEPESAAAVVVSDDNGLSSNPTLPADSEEEVLRLPSHRLHHHRPCSLHRHLWWKRHHGVYSDAPRIRRFRDHYSGQDGERREAVSRLAVLPAAAEEAREAEEVKPVAEPDPDRSLPDSDGDGEPSFADADGHDGERAAAVRAWKKEMLRRWLHFHFHHGMRLHRLHHVHHHDDELEAAPETESTNMRRFHFHHHDEEDDKENNMVRKRLRHAEHDHDEDEEVEEMVRRFRKAIMRRRFGHGGRRFFHHLHHDHRHRHAEKAEAEKQAAGGEVESGVVAWIKGLMNRF